MGLAVYIPKSWFDPLPGWMVPWVVAASILVFVFVAIWAMRQRRDSPVQFAPGDQGTMHRGGKVAWPSRVLVAVLAIVVFLLWFMDPVGSPPPS